MSTNLFSPRAAGGHGDLSRTVLPLATTPESITAEVKRFCGNISRHEPVYLDYVASGLRPSWCHLNVAILVEKFGGTCLPGWIIWVSSMLIEAEHHAVWHRPDNTLADVTPKVDGEQRILFLPDPGRPYDFRANLGWENKRQLKLPIPKAMKKMMLADARLGMIVSLQEVNAYLVANDLEPVTNVGRIRAPAISRGLSRTSNGVKK